jgi:hypothetical protein
MVLFELLELVRVLLDYLPIEYLWYVLIMPLTNRNGITPELRVDPGVKFAWRRRAA